MRTTVSVRAHPPGDRRGALRHLRLVLRDGLSPVGKGLLLGLGIGVASRIAVKAFVETRVSAVDPWPLLLLPIPFVLAALAACYFPAARASRVDPNIALREL
jgi:ABC-type antimicrobial peptide transport system permease subunit